MDGGDGLKPSKLFGYGLLAVSLIVPPVCIHAKGQPPCQVQIDECRVKVAANTCETDPGDTKTPVFSLKDWAIWTANDGHNYSISFANSSPFSSNPVIGRRQQVVGEPACNNYGSTNSSLCHYDYVLTQDASTICKDPGVRVVPPTGFQFRYLLFGLGSLLLSASALYVFFKMRARNRASV
jgi:hypothetical protein